MSDQGLHAATTKMEQAGVASAAIDAFAYYYGQLAAGATGLIAEESIAPLVDPPALEDVEVDEDAARAALARTVVVKLNGGLGTSMGLDRAKTLLPVRDGRTFLDLIVEQVQHARSQWGVTLPLVFMDSFRTQTDTLAALAAHPGIEVEGLPLDFLQSQEPKLLADGLTPVTWPADPSLEWCPPGHGDLYASLLSSGVLEALVDAGYRYASVSNADNLGASPDGRLAAWFAASGAPFAMEVCRRTAADRKGGHLAVRRDDGRLVLREVAQTADADCAAFADETRHAWFNTNSIWLDLQALRDALADHGSVLGLPLIRNVKTVDPADTTSPQVIQVETAMGAAIEVFEGATAIAVGRERFLPVKTTNDLLLLRSDAYDVGPDAVPRLAVAAAPLIDLDSRYYRTIADFEARFPHGVPSLRDATGLAVHGDWTFGPDVSVRGSATLSGGGAAEVPAGAVLS